MKSLELVLILFIYNSVFAQFENIRVSSPGLYRPEEVTIAINSLNPQVIAAGANLDYFFISKDGGLNWESKVMSSSFGVWGDPCVLFDGNENLYYAHLSNSPSPGYWIDRIVVQKSIDFGKTWSDGTGVGFNSPKNQDKEWLAVDLTDSQFKNNIYMSWTEFDSYGSSNSNDSSRILFSYTNDSGKRWSDPIVVSDVSGNCIDDDLTVEGAVPAVGPNGEVYISWAGLLGIMFDKSLDGGKTFGKDVFVTEIPGGWAFDVPGISRCNGLPITSCDVSDSPYRGNIYINWSDQRNGEDNTDIFLIKSTDGGKTWGEVKRVNTDTTSRHQFLSWMAVDPVTGFIYIVFYDRRNTVLNETEVYLARSVDGGETFDNFKISENIFIPQQNIFFGDYINIAAYNKMIRPIWMRMDNGELSVWTALITDSILVTGVRELQMPKLTFRLFQNYPNPFNPSTTIGYQIPFRSFVTLKVYDILGREIKTLVNEIKSPGTHEVNFNGEGLSSGIYYYTIKVGNFVKTGKMILVE